MLFHARLGEGHGGGNHLCLVEDLELTCGSVTLLSVADRSSVGSSQPWDVGMVPLQSLLSSINRLSILIPACLREGHRGGNRLCLVESLDLTCVSIALPG